MQNPVKNQMCQTVHFSCPSYRPSAVASMIRCMKSLRCHLLLESVKYSFFPSWVTSRSLTKPRRRPPTIFPVLSRDCTSPNNQKETEHCFCFVFLEKDKCGHYELLLDDWCEDASIAPIVFHWEKKKEHKGFGKHAGEWLMKEFVFLNELFL